MNIKTCRDCQKIFQSYGQAYCEECLKKQDDLFVVVRNYLYDNPKATVEDICESCKVEEDLVLGWLRDGRLLAENGASLLTCMSCGVSIAQGRVCAKCSSEFQNKISAARASIPAPAPEAKRITVDRGGGGGAGHATSKRR